MSLIESMESPAWKAWDAPPRRNEWVPKRESSKPEALSDWRMTEIKVPDVSVFRVDWCGYTKAGPSGCASGESRHEWNMA